MLTSAEATGNPHKQSMYKQGTNAIYMASDIQNGVYHNTNPKAGKKSMTGSKSQISKKQKMRENIIAAHELQQYNNRLNSKPHATQSVVNKDDKFL